jgi:hypothetical protein
MTKPEEERFTLANPAPPPPARRGPEPERTRQTVLFAGLDCLPGQQNLFATDGGEERGSD